MRGPVFPSSSFRTVAFFLLSLALLCGGCAGAQSPADPCEGVTCASGRVCVAGVCQNSTTDQGTPWDQRLSDQSTLPGNEGGVTQQVTLVGGTNVELAAVLATQTLDPQQPIRVVLPAGVTLCSKQTSQPALRSGDLSSYAQITLEIAGEVQGAGGAAGTAGGPALQLSSVLRLHVTSTGAIRGGGGGGGKGGKGGAGDDVGSWSAWQYSAETPKTFWSPTWGYIAWSDTRDIAVGQMCCSYAIEGGFTYEKGTQRTNAPLPILFEVRRAPRQAGVAGGGGAGGVGRGCEQVPTVGGKGGGGTFRAGGGGQGGAGGEWGLPGTAGDTGEAGLAYAANSATASQTGAAGNSGGDAGVAVEAAGLHVPALIEGQVDGVTTYVAEPF